MKKIFLLLFSLTFFLLTVDAEAVEQNVTINRFLTKAYVDNKDEAIPIINANVEIHYYDGDGNRIILLDGLVTNNEGELKDVTVRVPEGINRIYFRYLLENSEIGRIVNNKGITYHPITSTIIPENKIIDVESLRFFDNSMVEDAKQYTYQAIKVWNLYQTMVMETKSSVQVALQQFPELQANFDYQFKPLPVLYEYNCERSKAAVLARSSTTFGGIRTGDYYIHIPHLQSLNTMSQTGQTEFFNINLAHEWAHWAMHLAIGPKMAVGGYQNHYSYNLNEGMSYKEGWALFQSNRYMYGYDWNYNLDNSTQTSKLDSKYGKHEMCFGKSTNWTVNSAFRDIYDIASPKEPEDQFEIAQAWMPEVINADQEYRQKLSTGLLFIAMVDSNATTFAEYVAYLQDNDFIKDSEAFDQIMELNGFDTIGRFTLDGNGELIDY
mgnify:CR=1 FL=1